jgi:hypothetical protein
MGPGSAAIGSGRTFRAGAARQPDRWAIGTAVVLAPVLVALVVHRYGVAIDHGIGQDFVLFLSAARSMRTGASPYAVEWYVYSPALATLLAPVSSLSDTVLWHGWCLIQMGALLAAAGASVRALRLTRRWAPTAFLALSILVFCLWSTEMVVRLGQSDGVLLLCFAVGAMGAVGQERKGLVGSAIGAAALLKTWPLALAVFLLRRVDLVRRRREATALAVWLAAGVVLTLFLLGTVGVLDWEGRTLGKSTQPGLVSISAIGIPRLLFAGASEVPVLTRSVVLQALATVVLVVPVLAVLWVAVRRAHLDPWLGWWLTVGGVLLLLPVSHVWYRVFLAPLAFGWVVQAIRDRAAGRWRVPSAVMAAVAAGWLLVAVRVQTPGQGTLMRPFLVVFAADVALVVGSAIVLWRRSDPGPAVASEQAAPSDAMA